MWGSGPGAAPEEPGGWGWGGHPAFPDREHPTPPPPSPRGHGAPGRTGGGGDISERAGGGRRVPNPAGNHTQAGGPKRGRFQPNSHTPPVAGSGGEGGFWLLPASLEGRWRPRENKPTLLTTLPPRYRPDQLNAPTSVPLPHALSSESLNPIDSRGLMEMNRLYGRYPFPHSHP